MKITNVKFENVDPKDAPDFSDAYIVSADLDGEPMDFTQLDELNEDKALVYELLINDLY